MKILIRIPRKLYETMLRDLMRPHPFAAERVGVLYTKSSSLEGSKHLILGSEYRSIADTDYLDDPRSGARIGAGAIRSIMQEVLDHKAGAFHVHVHGHAGKPSFGMMDRRELPRLVESFRSVGPHALHGLLLLSHDSLSAWVWLPGKSSPVTSTRITVVGAPLGAWEVDAP